MTSMPPGPAVRTDVSLPPVDVPSAGALRGVPTYGRGTTTRADGDAHAVRAAVLVGRPETQEVAVTESPATTPDGPHPAGSGIREDGPTLSGLPDDAPDELRATLSGGNLGHIPTDAERDIAHDLGRPDGDR
jgi:hypothetical protein